jgi:hypothetical protein
MTDESLPSINDLFQNDPQVKFSPTIAIRIEPDGYQVSNYNIQPTIVVNIWQVTLLEIRVRVELLADMIVDSGFQSSMEYNVPREAKYDLKFFCGF